MFKQLTCSIAALAAIASSSLAQSTIAIPPHGNVYNGFSRGFSTIAATDFFINQLEVPIDAFQPTDTASFMIEVNGALAFYNVGGTAAVMPVTPPVQIATGDVVMIIGHWSGAVTGNFTAHNSYGSSAPFATTILGVAHTLDRAGWQYDIGDPAYTGAASFNGIAGSIGRCIVTVNPPSGIFAGISATSSTSGATPLTVDFADASFTDDPAGIQLYEWDFENDGVIDSNLQNPSHTYTVCGAYDVSLTVTDTINGSNSVTNVGFVNTDQIVASFTVGVLAPQVWQFTDTSTPPATAWAWDFDNDGVIDDTTQNPVYVAATASSCLSLPDVAFTATLACNSNTITGPVFAAASSFIGAQSGGNGTASANGVGCYFDIEITNAEGINICGIGAMPYAFSGPFGCEIYITDGTHVGKEGNTAAWSLAGSGVGTGVGAAFTAPAVCGVGLGQPFFLPAGSYGVAVYYEIGGGTTTNVAYTNGPAAAPYVGADMIIHPNGVGCSSTSTLGPCAFQPRLWNGGFYYEVCSTAQNAASGVYGIGCAGTAGVVPGLDAASMPVSGGAYSLDVTNMPAPGIALMMFGSDKTVFNGLPLPLDLGIVGAAGCNLHQSADVLATVVAVGSTGNWTFNVPTNPALTCIEFYNQAAVLDATANALGFSFSNARAGVIGN